MIPPQLSQKLDSLRTRERLLRIAWGAARAGAIVLALLLLACAIDWLVDRVAETPFWLRLTLFLVQAAVAVTVIVLFLVLPQSRMPDEGGLALLVEQQHPHLEHVLISAVQLNREGARIQGMSTELIVCVTREAEQKTAPLNFAGVADTTRLKRGAVWLLPVLGVFLLALALASETLPVLLARQLLVNLPIPRTIYLEDISKEYWASGEEVVLRYRVTGRGWHKDLTGAAHLIPDDGGFAESPELKFESSPKTGEAHFIAKVAGGYSSFRVSAYMGDGRTAQARHIYIVQRPIVTTVRAYTVFPKDFELSQVGDNPYKLEQKNGEIVGLANMDAQVDIKVQKEIVSAELVVLGNTPLLQNPSVLASALGVTLGAGGLATTGSLCTYLHEDWEKVSVTLPLGEMELLSRAMKLQKTFSKEAEKEIADSATVTFRIPETATGYRVVVTDPHGFVNVPPLRRGLRAVPEDAPRVALLSDALFLPVPDDKKGKLVSYNPDDYKLENPPLVAGEKLRIAYECSGPYGLGKAVMKYRVIRKSKDNMSSEDTDTEVPWSTKELIETQQNNSLEFDLSKGAFSTSKEEDEVEFYAAPSKFKGIPGRLYGGGRFYYDTKGIPDRKTGKLLQLKSGDVFEYRIEVYASKNADARRPVAQSEIRSKSVIDATELGTWIAQWEREQEQRLGQITTSQEKVIQPK